MPAWKNGIACSTYLLAIPSMNSSSTRAHAPNFIGERLTQDAFAKAYGTLGMPLCYNGDLFSEADCLELTRHFPNTHALMLGRGLIANPALCCGEPLTKAALIRFHARLFSAYQEKYPPHVALGRMREIAKHFVCCFEAPEKPRKAIRKAGRMDAYLDAMRRLFDEHELTENPKFMAE